MKYLKAAIISLSLLAVLFVPAAQADAATTASLLAQIQLLQGQIDMLKQELLLRNTTPLNSLTATGLTDCFIVSGIRYCVENNGLKTQNFSSGNDIDTIEVDFVGDIAQIRVEFDDRDTQFYAIDADTESEVAQALSRELNLSPSTILRLIDEVDNNDRDDNNNDIDSIDVTFDGDDADVVVRSDDDDTDRFTLRNVDRDEDEVISDLADRYDEDEDDIEDWIDFDNNGNTNNDDIRSIDVDFVGNDADVVVRFRNGNTDRFTLRNVDDDEDDVISDLADRYDMSERDIEDVIDFN